MSLKFEIQGTVEGTPGSIGGFELADLIEGRKQRRLRDPADPPGGHSLDDPADPPGSHGLDDPGGRSLFGAATVSGSTPPSPTWAGPGARPSSRLYSGFIVVRVSPLLPLPEGSSSLEEFAREHGLGGLSMALQRFGAPPSRLAIEPQFYYGDQVPVVSLKTLERQAAASAFRPRHSLRSYWRVDGRALQALTPGGEEVTSEDGLGYSLDRLASTFVEQLNALSEVGLAYRELAASDAEAEAAALDLEGATSSEELVAFQHSLSAAPTGLDVHWAREQLQAGAGLTTDVQRIAIGDLEQGWNREHQDLVAGELVHGENRRGVGSYRGDHGTAVLGQLVGKADNGLGVVGIAEGVAKISLASHFHLKEGGHLGEDGSPAANGCVAEAIEALLGSGRLGPGSVLLLEVQRALQPVEIDPLDFDAIRLATAHGVIVVQAAGNGGFDLDELETVDGRSLDRRSSKFQDSGAIVVGAAGAASPHDRTAFSNFGSRVDCSAWGGGVTTAGFGDLLGGGDDQLYTDRFSGTSSAAAMIAGAVALVQAVYQENAGPELAPKKKKPRTFEEAWERRNRLSPQQMRSLLSHPQAGAREGSALAGAIGMLPDLRKVLDGVLGIVPRVYLRDHEGDEGGEFPRRRRFTSPDIVVGNLSPSGGGLRAHVQLRNRGLREASQTRTALYCAPVLSLVTPDRWGEVVGGEASPPVTVLEGDVPLNVKHPEWHLPVENHCLIATVEHIGGEEAPRPCHRSAFHWPAYLKMLREQENVAMRNVHSLVPDGTAEFSIIGTPDVPRAFRFELLQRLPREVSVNLTAPMALAAKWSRRWLRKVRDDGNGRGDAYLHLPKQPRLSLGSLALPPGRSFPCSITLLGDLSSLREGHSIALRQLFQGEEVGRITWQLNC